MSEYSLIFSDQTNSVLISDDVTKPIPFDKTAKYFSASAPDLGLLPPVVRYISPWIPTDPHGSSSPFSFAIVEQPPAMRTVYYEQYIDDHYEDCEYYDAYDDDTLSVDDCPQCSPTKGSALVPVPWSYWLFQFKMNHDGLPVWSGVVNLYFSDSQAFDLSNTLYSPYFPNVSDTYSNYDKSNQQLRYDPYSSHTVCIGSSFFNLKVNDFYFSSYLKMPLGLSGLNFETLFRDYVSYYWSSPFNPDYSDRAAEFLGYYDPRLETYFDSFEFMTIDSASEQLAKTSPLFTLADIISYTDSSLPPISLADIFQTLSFASS